MKGLISSVFVLALLTSCSGGGGESGASPSITTNNGSASTKVDQEVAVAEMKITEVNSELNQSETYQLDKEELDLLLSENAISEEEYSELLALLK